MILRLKYCSSSERCKHVCLSEETPGNLLIRRRIRGRFGNRLWRTSPYTASRAKSVGRECFRFSIDPSFSFHGLVSVVNVNKKKKNRFEASSAASPEPYQNLNHSLGVFFSLQEYQEEIGVNEILIDLQTFFRLPIFLGNFYQVLE